MYEAIPKGGYHPPDNLLGDFISLFLSFFFWVGGGGGGGGFLTPPPPPPPPPMLKSSSHEQHYEERGGGWWLWLVVYWNLSWICIFFKVSWVFVKNLAMLLIWTFFLTSSTVLFHKSVFSQSFQNFCQFTNWRLAHVVPNSQHLVCLFFWWRVLNIISLNVIYLPIRHAQMSAQEEPAVSDIACQIKEIYCTWNTVWIFLSTCLSLGWWWTCLGSLNI